MVSKMPMARSEELVVQSVDQEILVYDLKNNKAICLNPTAKYILEMCDGETTEEQATKRFEKKFGVNSGSELINLSLKELGDANLLEDDFNVFSQDSCVTRRELVTRYGIPLATLPIVMALVAPTAVHAQSCVQPNDPCTAPADCCVPSATCFITCFFE